MDGEETQNCPNCKREIPSINFTIHLVHCARNIKVCPVCKEPVPSAELDDHHKKFHKLLPCKQCGEDVCGTDLEDHIRDSCANTIKTCRFCELELPRRELPAHEGYCGVRTELCPECQEWVMIKYKQLHVDSNHGFIRLDDDPVPLKKETPKSNIRWTPSNLATTSFASFSNSSASNDLILSAINVRPNVSAGVANNPKISDPVPLKKETPKSNIRWTPSNLATTSFASLSNSSASNDLILSAINVRPNVSAGVANNPKISDLKSNTSPTSASNRTLANEKPNNPIKPSPSAQDESSKENVPTASSSNKSNSQVEVQASTSSLGNGVKQMKNKLNEQPQPHQSIPEGAIKKRRAPKPPSVPPPDPRRDMAFYSALERQQREERQRREQNQYNLAHGLPPVLTPAEKIMKLRKLDALQNGGAAEEYRNSTRKPRRSPDEEEMRRQQFQNLKPMSSEQFLSRFSALQLRSDAAAAAPLDRFDHIKCSLRELRRGLNEVTAPYNNNANANNNNGGGGDAAVRLPCEFCGALVPPDDLVQHQTGCRPDLAQLRNPNGATAPPSAGLPHPLIPCEFCAESLPVYLITEHQERCAIENDSSD